MRKVVDYPAVGDMVANVAGERYCFFVWGRLTANCPMESHDEIVVPAILQEFSA